MTSQNISLSASFYSNDWEIVRKEKLHLFAEIDEQNFYLYATSDEKKLPVCFEQYALSQHQNFIQPENISAVHQQINWLKDALIGDFTVMIQNTPFQILPNEFNWLTNNGGWQCTDLQTAIDGKIVYEIAGLVNVALQNFSSNIKFKHPLSCLLSHVNEMLKPMADAVLCNVHQNAFDIVLWKSNKVQLINSYQMTTPEDAVYFLQLAMQQYELNPNKHQLYVSGEVIQQSLFFTTLSKFFRNIEFANRITMQQHGVFKNILSHRFLTLTGIIS
jgi:Protein of unknown function (DUF3822)